MIGVMLAGLLLDAASGSSSGLTIQQLFDTATAAMERADYPAALAGFEEIERRLPATSIRSRAIAEAQKGDALARLGRPAEAARALRHALPLLPTTDASLAEIRQIASSDIGLVEEQDLDFAGARRDYALAVAGAVDPIDRINARLRLARVTMFVDPDAALALTDTTLTDIAAIPSIKKPQRAEVHTLRGRILLNAGRFDAATKELLSAVDQLGGMTTQVSVADVAARSDLAIASLLAGNINEAKRYLAYSGAGNLKNGFAPPADMEPPACGEEGLDPHDVAVVEFQLADDGTAVSPRLIYGSARGDQMLLFPRAVASWSWTPKEVADVPPFFRQLLRVELRCSTAPGARPIDLLGAETKQWVQTLGVAPSAIEASSAASAVPLLRAELARRESDGGDPAKLLPTLLALAENHVATPEESAGWLDRAARIARDDRAPPIVQALLRMRTTTATHARPAQQIASIRTLLADPIVASDARAVAAVRLELAQYAIAAKARPDATTNLQQVIADDRLDRQDVLRVLALSRLATIDAAAGDLDAARAAYLQTGLSAGQCALADVRPQRVRGSIGSSDYPVDALQWGIGGWARTEYDVRADGTPANVRTLVAYPPFVFGPPTEKFVNRSLYTQSFRPGGQLGCSANQQSVRFAMPGQSHD